MPVKFDVDTKLIFNIGDPMDHSCATYMYNAVYALANVNAVNLTAVIPKGGLKTFIAAARTIAAAGFDLTTPHKADIVPFLDECESAAKAFRCVNSVKFQNGRLIGIGLDGVGLRLAVQNRFGSLKGRRVLLLGAGAVAGLAAYELCQAGVAAITVANRTVERAASLAETVRDLCGFHCEYGPMDAAFLKAAAKTADLALQCTSAGRLGEPTYSALCMVEDLPTQCCVADVLYPDTQLLAACRSRGLETMDGQKMMVFQQLPKMSFRFGIHLSEDLLSEVEDAVAVGVTMVQSRNRRLIKQTAQPVWPE